MQFVQIFIGDGKINRGCKTDSSVTVTESYLCQGDLCNKQTKVENCRQCNSTTEPDCLKNKLKIDEKCEKAALSCYRYESMCTIKVYMIRISLCFFMYFIESPENFDLGCSWKTGDDKCDPSISSTDCYMCYEDNCNTKRPLKCASCTSNADKICPDYDTMLCPSLEDKCFAKLTEGKFLKILRRY